MSLLEYSLRLLPSPANSLRHAEKVGKRFPQPLSDLYHYPFLILYLFYSYTIIYWITEECINEKW